MDEQRIILGNLKALDLSAADVTLAVLKEYKRDRISQYTIKYVLIDEQLESRLRSIVLNHISNSNSVEQYTYDCPEPEGDQLRAIKYDETDFYSVYADLKELTPEEDVIDNVEELVNSKAYLIVLRNSEGIQVVGFKTLPENWKMKKSKGLIPLLFQNNRFEDLESENVFSIASTVDILYFNEFLFILSKKDFERGLNFREGMIDNAEAMYKEARDLDVFDNINILTDRVGNNLRYLRKIATIRNLGYYRDLEYITRIRELSIQKRWNIQFNNNKIIITEESLDDILTLLQNKRLHSELTQQDFDVESVKLVSS